MDHVLSATAAQALQDSVTASGTWLMWFISNADPAYPGKITARAHTGDERGGAPVAGALVAGTLDGLRAMMPAGLTRRDRAPIHPEHVIETWD